MLSLSDFIGIMPSYLYLQSSLLEGCLIEIVFHPIIQLSGGKQNDKRPKSCMEDHKSLSKWHMHVQNLDINLSPKGICCICHVQQTRSTDLLSKFQ